MEPTINLKLALVFLWIFCFGQVAAQSTYLSNDRKFRKITLEDGLPGNSAISLLQDKNNFIWVGTFDGLVRYDGNQFKHYLPIKNDTSSLAGYNIVRLFEDSQGRIWIGTMRNGAQMLDPITEQFVNFPAKEGHPHAISFRYITSFEEDPSGAIWVGTLNGVNRITPQTNSTFKVEQLFAPVYSDTLLSSIEENVRTNNSIASIKDVGNNQLIQKSFTITQKATYTILSTGEAENNQLVDYGWLENSAGEIIWQLDLRKSRILGSEQFKSINPRNRVQFDSLQLSPGQYTLHFKSNSQHGFNNWLLNSRPKPFYADESIPAYSKLWGIHLLKSFPSQNIAPSNYTVHPQLLANGIYALQKHANHLWIGTEFGISILDYNNPNSITSERIFPGDAQLNLEFISDMSIAPNGQLWLLGNSSLPNSHLNGMRIQKFDQKSSKFIDIYHNDSFEHNGNLIFENENSLWFTNYLNGLYNLILSNDESFYEIEEYPLENKYICDIMLDDAANLWVGLWQKGIFKYSPDLNQFKFHEIPVQGQDKVVITNILEIENQEIWLATKNSGLYKYNFANRTHEAISGRDQYSLPADIRMNQRSMIKDRAGNIWVGTFNGLYILNQQGRILKTFLPSDSLSTNRLSNYHITSLFEDNGGHIWVGTLKGLNRIHPYNHQVQNIAIKEDDESIIGSDEINVIYQDHLDNIWLGMEFKGLGRVNIGLDQNGNSNYLFEGIELPSESIQDILAIGDTLWIGTYSDGLLYYDCSNQVVGKPSTNYNLNQNNVAELNKGQHYDLWLSTPTELLRFDRSTNLVRPYNKSDDVYFDFYNPGASTVLADGRMVFAGINGFYSSTTFLTEAQYSSAPKLAIIDFTVFDHEIKGGEIHPFENAISYLNNIRLSAHQNTFEIQFTALQFESKDKLNYAYQLEGLDQGWVQSSYPYARYTKIPPGNYIFKLKTIGFNGENNLNELQLKIHLPYPWYKHPITLFLYILLSLLITAFIFKSSFENKLAKAESVRLKELNAMKSRIFANISHEFRTPLSLILGPLSTLLKNNKFSERERLLLTTAQNNSKVLDSLITEILDLSKLEAGKMGTNEVYTELYPFIKSLVATFGATAEAKQINLKFAFKAEQQLVVETDKHKLSQVVNNLISNAIKHSKVGDEIAVEVSDKGRTIELTVQDQGPGIHEEDLPFIFDRFYQAKHNANTGQGGTGIGLALCKEIANLLDGKIWATSNFGNGSTFFFAFPKKEIIGFKGQTTSDLKPDKKTIEAAELPPLSKANEAKHTSSILIVEDNVNLRAYMQLILQEHFHILNAGNGQEAIVLLENKHTPNISLIISDIMMPIMDGFELMKYLKSSDQWRGTPLMILTAKTNVEDKLNALRIGVDDYLIKPFLDEELQLRVHNLIHNYRHRILLNENGSSSPGEKNQTSHLEVSKVDAKWLESFEILVSTNLKNENFTIPILADHQNLSERQLQRKVKQLTGLTPKQYLVETRLQKARKLLEEGAHSTVAEICYAVGFSSPAYFAKQFKARFGKAPSDYLYSKV